MSRIAMAARIAPACLAAIVAVTPRPFDEAAAAVARGELPGDYRDWSLISVAREEGDLDDIRAILGNDIAIEAYREGTRPFPNGSIIVRIAWSYDVSEENDRAFGRRQSFVAGRPKNGVQLMVKDSIAYALTGGWGYYHFVDGESSADQVLLQGCATCHQAAEGRDFVFTRYAP